MAIKLTNPPEGSDPDLLQLDINNGDLKALKNAVSSLGFKDEVSLLRYVLAVLSQSATRTLTVIDKDGKSIALNPSPTLLTEESQKPTE